MKNAALDNKKVLLGITGSIAAYKSAVLVRDLQRAGAEVKVVMTEAACKFINPLTLSTLSGNKVFTELIDDDNWNNHVELGLWADVMIIAPLTANTLAKMYSGQCDSMLLATWLSSKCPVAVAPAMDRDMYKHPSTRRNLAKMEEWNHYLIDAEYGELASGLIGEGRMAEPETICKYLSEVVFSEESLKLSQKKILVTAGPTYERIDPVRFIGNHSTGKMGIAIAEACAAFGAEVTLILGPTDEKVSDKNISIINIESAREMYDSVLENFDKMDAAFMVAAVSDYRPKSVAEEKIKKSDEDMHIELMRNPDIAASIGKKKKENQFVAGFALETENELKNAQKKLKEKNFDMIMVNSLKDEGAGFAHNTNKVTIVSSKEEPIELPLMSKKKVARKIIEQYLKMENI